jgi:thymidylate synthase (FAD)
MDVTLLDHTVDPANTIGKYAGICYDADLSPEKNTKRAQHCVSKGHLATLRFAYATFKIGGVSRVTSHQLVRVAHAGILQESQRYVKQSNIEWVRPPSIVSLPLDLHEQWEQHLTRSNQIYEGCIQAGMRKEDARYILPQSCTTSLVITGNFQMWLDLLGNRTAKAAQWEIRDTCTKVQNILHGIAPEIFDEIVVV